MGQMFCEILEQLIEWQYDKTEAETKFAWEEAFPAFNDGQQVIFVQELFEPLEEVLEYFNEEWPWVDASEYVEAMYGAYQIDVLERAFSDTIQKPVPEMIAHIQNAQDLQDMYDYMCFF